MSPDEVLRSNTAARTEMVVQLAERLHERPEVLGVVLIGSLGREQPDAWSDVDVLVFVEDERLDPYVAIPSALPSVLAAPLYCLDSPWNAPAPGTHVGALYALPSGCSIYVDWYAWPGSLAAVPTDAKVLWERQPLARVDLPFSVWSASFERRTWLAEVSVLGQDGLRHVHFGMLPIAAKFFARRDQERFLSLMEALGWSDQPTSAAAGLQALRGLLDRLAPGESPEAREAVATLISLAGAHAVNDVAHR